ncbi:macrophage mannose receptor 1 isoform X2 [Sinocyclocheilus anshuiensis]|uniref:macrophage mannose receptor 1 isoform X2 n=1 Tax=Sinocyclocheilus anshuiensis TaxID=1608454 RepID=UPI0007B9BE89|nr:PREDICTED: macrophage mannose receptor 1-like isoform X2 [Sinocyclocheilus anshuiensis]
MYCEQTCEDEMMQNKIQLVVLLGILSKASCDPCRFVLIGEPKTWAEAQSYCREKHTDLATVQSDEDRAKLKEAANAVSFRSVAWIGFYKVFWLWSHQNTIISYAKWGNQEPNLLKTHEACATVSEYGQWSDISCTELKYFFCQTDKQAELKDKFKYTEKYMNWHDAQTHCRSHEIDLATVTNDTENAFLANVLDSENDRNAWIGLSKRQGLWQWQWSDNSSVSSSVQWESGQPDNVNGTEDCVSADTDGLMADDTCLTVLPFYCRENTKIQRVRFAVKSDGSLDESAVMEAIEKKMKQILSGQDMKIRYSITWSVQPDEKIFQQQKTQENTQDTATACEELGPMKR